MLQPTIYRISKFSYLKNCRVLKNSLHVILNEDAFSFSKNRWNAFSKTTVRGKACFSKAAIQGACSRCLLGSLQKQPSSDGWASALSSSGQQGLGVDRAPGPANPKQVFLSWEQEVKQRWALPGFPRRKRDLDGHFLEQTDSFSFFFFSLLQLAYTCHNTLYPSLMRSLENDKLGDRRHREQQHVQPSGDTPVAATAKPPAHAWLPRVLGRVVQTLCCRGAGHHASSPQRRAVLPYPLGQIMTELKQERRC